MAKQKSKRNSIRDVAIVAGIRTPLGKSSGIFDTLTAVDLAVLTVREVLARTPVQAGDIDQLIIGNELTGVNAF